MNFLAMKAIINSLLNTYKCPACNEGIKENNIDIVGAAGNAINIDVECPKCKKHSLVKAEVAPIDFRKLDLKDPETLKKLLAKAIIQEKTGVKNNSGEKENLHIEAINDQEIVNFNKALKKKGTNISDLFL